MDPLELSLVRSHIADLQRDAAAHRTRAAAPRATDAPFLMTLDALLARASATARGLLRPRAAAGPDVCCA